MKISTSSNNKYKDEKPENTITRIRNILNSIGIFTIEENWKNSAKGFCSVTIKIPDTNLQTNGKGTSYKYALASGYAELMERLQNQAQFRLSIDVSPEALKYKGFYYAPDEKHLDIGELLDSNEDWIKQQLKNISTKEEKDELISQWAQMSNEDSPKDFIALPYMNVNTKRLSYIPVKMLSKMYMSNGMCAGNTLEEALVQGLSEIFERVVNKKIINDKLTPPTIPEHHIRRFPRLDNMINEIEASGNCEIIVKDCSLGKRYPVIGVLLIDKNEQKYFVKFGSHPKFEIALERTLTELLQGQDIKNMMGVKEYSYFNEFNEADNLMGILVNGSGFYPNEFFSSRFSYISNGFEEMGEPSNKEMLRYLMNLLEDEGYHVFIRDVSFLGFPSYHIIVPGFSEIENLDNVESLEKYLEYSKIKNNVRNFNDLEPNEIDEVIKHMEKYNGGGSIVQFLNLPISNVFPWYYTNTNLYIAALSYKNGDYLKAYEAIDIYVKAYASIGQNHSSVNRMMRSYYKCARDFIGAHIDYDKKERIIEMLRGIYPLNVVNGVVSDFGDEENILNRYGELKCWNCEECKLRSRCSYRFVENVYKRLKYVYSKNQIDQNKLKEFFEDF